MKGYYNQVIAMLQQHGYYFFRAGGKGSHELWTNGKRHQTVSKNIASRHMANAIMKQAKIEHRF